MSFGKNFPPIRWQCCLLSLFRFQKSHKLLSVATAALRMNGYTDLITLWCAWKFCEKFYSPNRSLFSTEQPTNGGKSSNCIVFPQNCLQHKKHGNIFGDSAQLDQLAGTAGDVVFLFRFDGESGGPLFSETVNST